MEDEVRDCFHGEPSDPILANIVDLTATSLVENRPLFANPLDEPSFFKKYIKRWIKEELDTDLAIARKQAQDRNALDRMQF
jgi:hypothetical protein